MQNAKLNNFDPHARVAIRIFEDWQMKIFKKNAKKGWRFFQPDQFDKPTPRSAREAWAHHINLIHLKRMKTEIVK